MGVEIEGDYSLNNLHVRPTLILTPFIIDRICGIDKDDLFQFRSLVPKVYHTIVMPNKGPISRRLTIWRILKTLHHYERDSILLLVDSSRIMAIVNPSYSHVSTQLR